LNRHGEVWVKDGISYYANGKRNPPVLTTEVVRKQLDKLRTLPSRSLTSKEVLRKKCGSFE